MEEEVEISVLLGASPNCDCVEAVTNSEMKLGESWVSRKFVALFNKMSLAVVRIASIFAVSVVNARTGRNVKLLVSSSSLCGVSDSFAVVLSVRVKFCVKAGIGSKLFVLFVILLKFLIRFNISLSNSFEEL